MQTRTAILKEAEIFGARVADSSVEGFALEATGDPEKLDEFIDVMRSYGEIAVTLETKRLRLSPPIPTASAAPGASRESRAITEPGSRPAPVRQPRERVSQSKTE
jgi:acetolactate synthase-1/3 small subunit